MTFGDVALHHSLIVNLRAGPVTDFSLMCFDLFTVKSVSIIQRKMFLVIKN